MPKLINLIGQNFGRLEVIKLVGKDKHRNYKWLCLCNCDDKNEIIVRGYDLKNGHTKSCGCLQKENASIHNTKHGHNKIGKRSKIYQAWVNMIARCTNPNNLAYHNYGDRGITVCKEWLNSFPNFLEDMGKGWELGLTIERIKNEKGYCKENCRWATRKEQQRNTRRSRLISFNGKNQCISDLAKEFGVHVTTLRYRIDKLNWPIGKALVTPTRKKSTNER